MFSIRAATHADRPLIFATWLRAFRHGSLFPRRIRDGVYFAEHHDVIERLLERSFVHVATPPDEPEVVLGWSAVETLEPPDASTPSPVAIHFVYVKPPFRRAGIARRLLEFVEGVEEQGGEVFFSHDTFALKLDGIAPRVARWTFNPYLALRGDRSDNAGGSDT